MHFAMQIIYQLYKLVIQISYTKKPYKEALQRSHTKEPYKGKCTPAHDNTKEPTEERAPGPAALPRKVLLGTQTR